MQVFRTRPSTNRSHIFGVDLFFFTLSIEIDDLTPFLPLILNQTTSLSEKDQKKEMKLPYTFHNEDMQGYHEKSLDIQPGNYVKFPFSETFLSKTESQFKEQKT